jgi:DUF1680 family protein
MFLAGLAVSATYRMNRESSYRLRSREKTQTLSRNYDSEVSGIPGQSANILLLMFSAMAMILAVSTTAPTELAVKPTMLPAKASYHLDGLIGKRLGLVTKNWLMSAPDNNPAMLGMFANRDKKPYRDLLPWSGEFAGKYLTAACEIYSLSHSPALKRKLAQFVRDFVAYQDADGYLGPFPTGYRLSAVAPNIGGAAGDSWDAWGHYHAMIGMLRWNEETGDAAALQCACRMGDLLCKRFAAGGVPVSSVGNPGMNQSIVHALAILYRRTSDKRYLDAAERVVQDFSSPNAGDYLRSALAGKEFYELPNQGPRWESLHSLMGLVELYWITGNRDYRTAFERLWMSIEKNDRHNNGGFSSGEQAQGNPYDPRPIETCCTIAWIALSVEMLKLTGDPKVADELELSTLNQAVGIFSSDCKWSTYNTPMDGVRIPSTEDIAFQIRAGSEQLNCCSVNAPRGLGMIGDWALMRQPSALVLNWYGPSTMETSIDGVDLSLCQTTDYPRVGHIDLRVSCSRAVKFALKLRVPHWSRNSSISVNGQPIPCQSGNYAVLDRVWRTGDLVSIDFDMSLRYWVGEREEAGKTSVYRGPLLFALEAVPIEPKYQGTWGSFPPMQATKEPRASVVAKFDGDSIRWNARKYDDAGLARVSIDGKQIEDVDLYAAGRDIPFTWQRHGLGSGVHTIRIEALGTNSAKSKNVWINCAGFETPNPSFDRKVIENARFFASPAGFGFIEATSTDGQSLRLIDYASAGQNRRPYRTWLNMAGLSNGHP